ncbi:MAG TPA: glycosyltransferase family 1 protein [Thermoanaerobaculia bacterium]|jgi:glycosyltransferase involved in cell wall biosynthesis|nr:glycosyltransferase family 1 protein [Thermoanaerobaculia bacterium]
MLTAGLVSVDPGRKWIGGRYYLQHLVRAVASLPQPERIGLADVWWQQREADDPFAEVRELLAESVVIAPPVTFAARARRKARRLVHGWRDARDLFLDAGVGVLFPIAPCANPGIPLVFWMPDFQPWRMAELFSSELRTWYERHYITNGQIAARIVVSSNDGLRDLETYLPQFREKARVLHFCSIPTDEWWQRDPAGVAGAYGLPEKFFLLANQFSHHKNHPVVFEAVRRLRARGVPAVVACTGSTFGFRGNDYLESIEAFLREHDLTGAVRILDLIPRADQVALMRRAIAILQPSQFEGWSTVVEDAKTLGKPILVSDLPVHREQAPPNGVFLPAGDAEAWAEAMEKAWNVRPPGPQEDEEAAGASAVSEAQIETGRTFVSIVREAAGR